MPYVDPLKRKKEEKKKPIWTLDWPYMQMLSGIVLSTTITNFVRSILKTKLAETKAEFSL